MARSPRTLVHGWAWLSLAGVLVLSAGCGKSTPSQVEAPAEQTAPAVAGTPTPPSAQTPAAESANPKVVYDDKLQQSFAQATRKDPPEGVRPPDQTMTGKSVGKLYDQVVKTWDTIRFVNDKGQKIQYSAIIQTKMGEIEIELHPEWAPNHVRNFIALSKVGYYDGLCFDRIIQDESDVEQNTRFQEIEAGCARGTGEPGADSLGYWLNPETNPEARHVEGSVGACRGIERDTAACKFYITLCKADYLDGHYTVFGKITRGLDVARKIFMQPTIIEEQDVDGSRRPLKPVVMDRITIVSKEVPQ